MPEGKSIVDFGFLDENSLLLLCCTAGKSRHYKSAKCLKLTIAIGDNPGFSLIKISHQSATLLYRHYEAGQRPSLRPLDMDDQTLFCTRGFSHLSHFTPVQMMVQKSCSLRGEIPGRVCLVGKDRAMYKTYALPRSWEDVDTNGQ